MGYKLVLRESSEYYFGGVHAIRATDEGFHGGADPRRDGSAMSY